jgi:hypothetical protein
MGADETIAILEADEYRRRDEWERTREQCFYSVAPYNDKIKQASDLFKFPWDNKKKKKQENQTKEQVDRKIKQVKKWLDKKK